MNEQDQFQKALKLVQDARLCMLTTLAADDRLVSRPMALQQAEQDGTLWLLVDRNADSVAQIARNPQVNLGFDDKTSWVSVAGEAAMVEDPAMVKELWNPAVEAWFPNGPESAEVGLMRIDAKSMEYWDSPGGRIASVLSFVKSKATGQRLEGENEVVDVDSASERDRGPRE